MFLLRWQEVAGGPYTVLQVRPYPTEVEYPERRLFTRHDTADGAVVLQRPLRDPRPRKWIWRGYRPYIPAYATLWEAISPLETKARAERGAPLTIELWENESTIGGFGRTTNGLDPDLATYSNLRWTQVRVLQVDRTPRSGGGPVTYEQTVLEFVIADERFSDF